jgi:hypothetical protein
LKIKKTQKIPKQKGNLQNFSDGKMKNSWKSFFFSEIRSLFIISNRKSFVLIFSSLIEFNGIFTHGGVLLLDERLKIYR